MAYRTGAAGVGVRRYRNASVAGGIGIIFYMLEALRKLERYPSCLYLVHLCPIYHTKRGYLASGAESVT